MPAISTNSISIRPQLHPAGWRKLHTSRGAKLPSRPASHQNHQISTRRTGTATTAYVGSANGPVSACGLLVFVSVAAGRNPVPRVQRGAWFSSSILETSHRTLCDSCARNLVVFLNPQQRSGGHVDLARASEPQRQTAGPDALVLGCSCQNPGSPVASLRHLKVGRYIASFRVRVRSPCCITRS